MTDSGSTPSHDTAQQNDIESLAARAKEMLARVQGSTSPDGSRSADPIVVATLESKVEVESVELEVPETLPETDVAEVELSDFELSDIEVPETLPETDVAEVELSDFEVPDVPDLEPTNIEIPELPDELPEIDVAELPDIEIPELPDAELTELDVADLQATDIEIPELPDELPEIDVPELPDANFDEVLLGTVDEERTLDEVTPVDVFADVDAGEDSATFSAEASDPTAVADQIVSELDADLSFDTELSPESEVEPTEPGSGLEPIIGLDAGLDIVTGDSATETESEKDTDEPAAPGLQLEEDLGFETVDFGDLLGEEDEPDEADAVAPSYIESMDPEVAALAEIMPSTAATKTPAMERVAVAGRPKPAYSIDGGVDELFLTDDEEESGAAAATSGWGLRGLLVALAIIALFLVFFGDRFVDWITADDPVEQTETGPDADVAEDASAAEEDGAPDDAETTNDGSTTVEDPSTTAPPTTDAPSTAAPTPIPETAWEVLGANTNTSAFASLGGPLGLEERLSSLTDYTLFAPSDEAITALTPDELGALAADPEQATALLDYHIVEGRVSAADLLANDGGQLESITGLPILVSVDGDQVILNGTTRVNASDFEAEASTVHVVDGVLAPPTINEVLNLGSIQFEVISSRLTPEGIAELDKAVAFFDENPDAQALIEGHTDTDGDADANQRLSERRANAVREYLVGQGIAGDRLVAQGFGESEPIIIDGVEDKVASRRIEFVLR